MMEAMDQQAPNPFQSRAESLRQMTPAFVADLFLYESADGGKSIPALPGWGCPCVPDTNDSFGAFDGWPILEEPLRPGEKRAGVPFVFLTSEGAEAMRRSGRFFLQEGRRVGEAVIVLD